jgi:hypothetical protein
MSAPRPERPSCAPGMHTQHQHHHASAMQPAQAAMYHSHPTTPTSCHMYQDLGQCMHACFLRTHWPNHAACPPPCLRRRAGCQAPGRHHGLARQAPAREYILHHVQRQPGVRLSAAQHSCCSMLVCPAQALLLNSPICRNMSHVALGCERPLAALLHTQCHAPELVMAA